MKKFLTIALSLVLALFFCLPEAAGAAPKVDFIDVSHWNGNSGLPLSFYQTLKRGHIDSAVVKVSDGTNYIDPAASVNVANARQAGMIVNAYHFARFTSSSEAKQEAIWFDKQLKYVGFDKLKDGIVVVDVELRTANRSTLTNAVNAFVSEMHQLGYPTVDLYSGSSFFSNSLYPSKLSIKQPWLARYSASYQQPIWPTGKGAWQWSSSYHFAGISGNFDVSQDFAGKYTVTSVTPNATAPGVVKKIGSVSLVNYMSRKHMDASYRNRAKLAKAYGITSYSGTAAQNLALLSKLKSGVKPAPKPKAMTVSATSAYTVRSGDTLWEIAQGHHTTVSKIQSLNGLHSALIFPGQKLKLSASTSSKSSSTVSSSKAATYTVRSGDSLGKIASQYHTTVSAIAKLNGIRNVNLIRVGQKLKLSGTSTVKKSTAKKVSSRTYMVRRGDTLWAISRAKHTTVGHLTSLNHLHSSLIFPGQKIKY